MIDELPPDIRNLLGLTRRIENFDATVIAARMHAEPLDAGAAVI